MAFPGTAQEITDIFKIFGIPQNATGFVVGRIISLYGPAGNVYDFTAIVNQLNTQLGNVTATQYVNISALIAEWNNITDYSELQVGGDNTTSGQLVDHDRRRRGIRKTLANTIGFYVPEDGFFTVASGIFAGASGQAISR